jgi:hypothetical protein
MSVEQEAREEWFGGWSRYVAKGKSESTTMSVVCDLHSDSISLTQQRAHVDFQIVVFILG